MRMRIEGLVIPAFTELQPAEPDGTLTSKVTQLLQDRDKCGEAVTRRVQWNKRGKGYSL
jgi:hypothetical protein